MSERDLFTMEPIPDFAMQPARESDDGDFDPAVYERLLAGLEVWEPASEPVVVSAPEPEPEPVNVPELIPAATASQVNEGPSQGEADPVCEETSASAPEPATKFEEPETKPEGVVVLAGDDVVLDGLRVVDMVPCDPVRIQVEEDILVPDVKPDLASILNMDGTLHFTERDRKISGELTLQTLYVPQGKGSDRAIIAIESRLPFQQTVREGTGAAEDIVGMRAAAKIESLEYSVINERKFRVKASILVEARQYRNRKLELFEGLQGDQVQCLQEKLVVTDVILRKTELLEVEEELMLPDSMPQVGTILRCDVNLVENHKQISRDKAVISGTAYYNIMYLPLEEAVGAGKPDGAAVAAGESVDGEPILFQAKGEFTQFVALGRLPSSPKARENSLQADGNLGGRTFFELKKSTAEPKDSEDGTRNRIHVKLEGETFLELYQDVERLVVTDAYHHQKEMVFDTEETTLMQICPGGIGETTVREVISVPESVESMKRVSFLSGDLRNVKTWIENGRNVTEGVVLVKLVCLAESARAEAGLSEDGRQTVLPFQIQREIPFRTASEIPSGMEHAAADNEVKLKELRFDRLNDRQIEVTASVVVNGAVVCRKRCPMIRNVGFVESGTKEKEMPGMILYISRSGDSLWKIARKYRTTIETLEKINGIDGNAALAAGTKLLIVK